MADDTSTANTPAGTGATATGDGQVAAETKTSEAAVAGGSILTGGQPAAAKVETAGAEKTATTEPTVPEKYEFKLPEGQQIDAAAVESLTPIFKDLKLSQEGAQKLVGAYAEHLQKVEAQRDADFKTYLVSERKTHEAALRKEWGGQYDAQIAIAQRAVARFASPALKQLLDDTGIGNHAEFVKAFVPIGRMIQEDTLPAGGNPSGRRSTEEVLYGQKA